MRTSAPRRTRLPGILAALLLLASVSGLSAQVANLSDASMTMITSGDMLSGAFGEPGTTLGFSCPSAWGVRSTVDRAAGWYTGITPVPSPFASISAVLPSAGAVERPLPREQVLASLIRDNGRAARAAEALLEDFDRFLAAVASLDPARPDPRIAGQLVRAVDDFNRFVNLSSESFLDAPPAEFLAIRATLGELVAAATQHSVRPADPTSVDMAGLACAPGVRPESQAANFPNGG